MTTDGQSIPFNEVLAAGSRLTTESFLALPLYARVKHILSGDIEFSLDGAPIEKTMALRALRTLSAAS